MTNNTFTLGCSSLGNGVRGLPQFSALCRGRFPSLRSYWSWVQALARLLTGYGTQGRCPPINRNDHFVIRLL